MKWGGNGSGRRRGVGMELVLELGVGGSVVGR